MLSLMEIANWFSESGFKIE